MRQLYHTLIIVASLSFYSFALYAQAPGGNYYQNADGKKGQALKTALFHIIANHTTVSYKDIWTAYETTDMRDDGYVYDIYSNITNYRYKTDQAGNYKKGGNKGFDTCVTRLQSQGYVIISDFVYMRDKFGKPYGWGVAEYSTPEAFMGGSFTEKVYSRSPDESFDRILEHFCALFPNMPLNSLKRFIGKKA